MKNPCQFPVPILLFLICCVVELDFSYEQIKMNGKTYELDHVLILPETFQINYRFNKDFNSEFWAK